MSVSMRTIACAAVAVLAATATTGVLSHGSHLDASIMGPLECKSCEFAVTKLESFLAQNTTAAKVEAAAEGLCEQIMPNKVKECEGLVEMGVEYAVHYIETNLKPHDVCADAGLCKATEAMAKAKTADSRDMLDADQCSLCEWVASKAKDFIDSKDAEKQIDDLCAKIDDKPQADECLKFVQQYFPIVKHLVDHMQAEDVCKQVHFCHSTDYSGLIEALNGAKPGCAMCEFAIKEAKSKLSDKKIQKQIISGLEKECKIIGKANEKIVDGCSMLVQQYGPMLLEAALEKMSPEWCSNLGVC